MNLNGDQYGAQSLNDADREYHGSRFSEVREALFRDRYYVTWGTAGDPPLPTYEVTLRRTLGGLLHRMWHFQDASHRIVGSQADMRWGPDGKGFRRLLHPNGICLLGEWIIDDHADTSRYTGYFRPGSRGLVVARYSTCCTETRGGRYRSLALIGKLYPTQDRQHPTPLVPASFVTQQDFGGERTSSINEALLRNTPNTTPWRRGTGLPVLLLTGLVLLRADRRPTSRQLYQIAELGKPAHEKTHTPKFLRFSVAKDQPRIPGDELDFREEILAQIYDRGEAAPKRRLTFTIEISDEGYTKGLLVQRQIVTNWKPIGRLVFDEAVASYSGDFVIHAHHPPWRNDENDPRSVARRHLRR